MKKLLLGVTLLVVGTSALLANGGAWQTGVPGTGSASASNQNHKSDVTIDDEALKIDLYPEYAAVEVRYRMHNTGSKTQQDFFFPVERWGKNPDADTDTKSADIRKYEIIVDGKKLPFTNVSGPKEQTHETKSGQLWQEDISTIKSWKSQLFRSTEIKSARSRFVTMRSTPKTTNQFLTTHI
jgi:hypothetical protein